MRLFKRNKTFCLAGNWINKIQKVRVLAGSVESDRDQFMFDSPPRVMIYDGNNSTALFKGNVAQPALDELLRIGIYTKDEHQYAVTTLQLMQDEYEQALIDRDNVTELHAVS